MSRFRTHRANKCRACELVEIAGEAVSAMNRMFIGAQNAGNRKYVKCSRLERYTPFSRSFLVRDKGGGRYAVRQHGGREHTCPRPHKESQQREQRTGPGTVFVRQARRSTGNRATNEHGNNTPSWSWRRKTTIFLNRSDIMRYNRQADCNHQRACCRVSDPYE